MQDESIPLLDEEQTEILIHCAVHFGKNLNIMLDYYKQEGPGVNEDFSIKNINHLALFQKENSNFIDETLHEEDLKLIKTHLKQYHQLQEVYENPQDQLSTAICDLILTEEREPNKEIDAVIAHKDDAMLRLLTILKLQTFHSPLSPGYGLAPFNAAKALGKMQAIEAIKPLFSLMQRADFEKQEILITALKSIKNPAKEFLISRLEFTPFNLENESAAICLSTFEPDESIQASAKKMLKQNPNEVLKEYLTYLL